MKVVKLFVRNKKSKNVHELQFAVDSKFTNPIEQVKDYYDLRDAEILGEEVLPIEAVAVALQSELWRDQ